QRGGICSSPTQGCSRVVEAGRKRMFGSQPVRDAQNLDSRVSAENPARLVMRIEVADDKTSTVKIDSQVACLLARRIVARHQWPFRSIDLELAHCCHFRDWSAISERLVPKSFTSGLDIRLDQSGSIAGPQRW